MANRDVNLDWIKCARKIAYRTRKGARDAATRLGRRDHVHYHTYACEVCGAFHLSSKGKR